MSRVRCRTQKLLTIVYMFLSDGVPSCGPDREERVELRTRQLYAVLLVVHRAFSRVSMMVLMWLLRATFADDATAFSVHLLRLGTIVKLHVLSSLMLQIVLQSPKHSSC